MADKSAIEWTDATWNPVTGCSKVSPGCAHCYAETMALTRLTGKAGYPGLPWTPENAEANVVLRPERLDLPLRWRKPRRVFVNSMSDLFHELVPGEFIARRVPRRWRWPDSTRSRSSRSGPSGCGFSWPATSTPEWAPDLIRGRFLAAAQRVARHVDRERPLDIAGLTRSGDARRRSVPVLRTPARPAAVAGPERHRLGDRRRRERP